ncbi:MAG: hypothetical protein H6898_07485 [Rhodobacter sp.]|nr:hypothetical protein [Paracoccaceae bacterium]MCC0076416.1 hypothetical protein [Rhodobacter sp.]
MLIRLNAPRLWTLVLAGVLVCGTVATLTAQAASDPARPVFSTSSAL